MKHIKMKASSQEYRLIVSQEASLEAVFEELKVFANQLANIDRSNEQARLVIETPNQILPQSLQEAIHNLIDRRAKWEVVFTSNVMSHETAVDWHKSTSMNVEFHSISSGEIVEIDGDVLLIGDVEPGAYIRATGNIFIVGSLEGIAHAGVNGDTEAVIVGTFSTKAELQIARASYSINHLLDDKSHYTPRAYYVSDRGVIDACPVSQISQVRPDIDKVVSQLTSYETLN